MEKLWNFFTKFKIMSNDRHGYLVKCWKVCFALYVVLIKEVSLPCVLFFSFFMSMGWNHISELFPPTGLLFIPRWYMSVESHGEIILTGKTEKFREKYVSVPLRRPQNSNWMTRARTRASAMRGRRLTAWAIAQHFFIAYQCYLGGAITQAARR
jgi:hypothetical protein